GLSGKGSDAITRPLGRIFKAITRSRHSLSAAFPPPSAHIDRDWRDRHHQTEGAMLKHISVCATFAMLAMSPLKAQQQEAALQHVELPGVGFDIALATPKSAAATIDLGDSPDALILHLTGGELALAFEDASKMLEASDLLQHPGCAFRARGDGRSAKPVSVYVVPKREPTAGIRTASLDGQSSQSAMRKVRGRGANFDIVYTTTSTPIAWEPDARPDALAVYSAGYERVMATDGDIKRMFKTVGLSQSPICVFYVEHKGSNPPLATSVYIVPEGDATTSPSR